MLSILSTRYLNLEYEDTRLEIYLLVIDLSRGLRILVILVRGLIYVMSGLTLSILSRNLTVYCIIKNVPNR